MRNSNADNSDLLAKKKKINQMVIVNGVVFLVSHMPEFVVTILLLVFRKNLFFMCSYVFSCDLIIQEAEFFNSISIVCTFYVLLVFDRNFKESFYNILKKKVKNQAQFQQIPSRHKFQYVPNSMKYIRMIHKNFENFSSSIVRTGVFFAGSPNRKLEYKEMLYIRKLKPTINKQTEGELFAFVIRNVKLETSIERDLQKG